ncbi:MAG: hypothetical protein KGI29_04515 [Pseudomonadota bacterium]|nr:hypothetical protein [Pseudomonadota bacterium]MDE3037311.1 hypothetical protein [Pseudomonadota bacterium]
MSNEETPQHFVTHVDNTILPKTLSTAKGYPGNEVALLRGFIQATTGLDPEVSEQAPIIDGIYANARRAVVEALEEQGDQSASYKQWVSGGDYKPGILATLGASVGQFSVRYHDNIIAAHVNSKTTVSM